MKKMNSTQQDLMDYVVAMNDMDSVPLFFSDDPGHKSYQMAHMLVFTQEVWSSIDGVSPVIREAIQMWLDSKGRYN